MKVSFIVIVVLLAMSRIANAGCWEQKQDETNKIKEQVIVVLESVEHKEWIFASGKELQYTKTLSNKKEIIITISDWGTLSMDGHVIDMPDTLQTRVKRLYKKICCSKVFKEVLLMKEFLGM